MARHALLSDIHSNLPALEACIDHADEQGVDGFALLGDFVGYGAEPGAVLERLAPLVAAGAPAVRGNHDDMGAAFEREMNPAAATAASWTRDRLSPAQRAFLADLPLTARLADAPDVLLVHASADAPDRWHYVLGPDSARRSLAATDARVVICGHVHTPAIYGAMGEMVSKFTPVDGVAVPLMATRRWQVVLGSVGQPRDGNPAASYAIYDTLRQEITFQRVPYDVRQAAEAIRAAGLPTGLADRLHQGR
jgi:diadenosine tetraphosphatase ApaH/serine/threonine PP2A family protein phosphatase